MQPHYVDQIIESKSMTQRRLAYGKRALKYFQVKGKVEMKAIEFILINIRLDNFYFFNRI